MLDKQGRYRYDGYARAVQVCWISKGGTGLLDKQGWYWLAG